MGPREVTRIIHLYDTIRERGVLRRFFLSHSKCIAMANIMFIANNLRWLTKNTNTKTNKLPK